MMPRQNYFTTRLMHFRFSKAPWQKKTEAKKEVEGNPLSFLHVTKPEVDLPTGTDPYSNAVYAQAKSNIQHFIDRHILFQDEKPCYYIYELAWKGRTQTGLVCVSSIEVYFNDVIKKH